MTSCCHDPHVKLFTITREAYVQNGTAFIQGFKIAPDNDITGTASSAPSTTADGTATTSAQASNQLAATGLGVGLGVGLGIGIPLLAAIGTLSFLLLREKGRSRDVSARRGSARSMGERVARPPVQAEPPRTPRSMERLSTQAGSPRTGLRELPNTQFTEADVGQRTSVHELHGKEHLQAAELPDAFPKNSQ